MDVNWPNGAYRLFGVILCAPSWSGLFSERKPVYVPVLGYFRVAEANNDKKSAQKGHKSEVDTSALCAHPAALK